MPRSSKRRGHALSYPRVTGAQLKRRTLDGRGIQVELGEAISRVRESVVAVIRIRESGRKSQGKKRPMAIEYKVSFGTGFCVVDDKYVVTAFHNLNEGKAPTEKDRHYVMTVPGNGGSAFHFQVVAMPLLRQDLDIAVLEIGPCATEGIRLPSLPVTVQPQQDGTRVVTVGFPAPEVHGLSIDPQGNYMGGNFFLKSHANEGIVAAHYELGSLPVYELNVAWHHGESGGPIATVSNGEAAVFSLMQQYRNVQSPHGILPGPHRGVSLAVIRDELEQFGVPVNAV